MALEDQSKERLLDLAGEHDVTGRHSMSKDELVEALDTLGVEVGDDAEEGQVSGFQAGPEVPNIPQTPREFAQLTENPDLPPENQSAPSPEQLNPHLYTGR